MISKLFCLLGLLSMLIQGREASIVPVVETIPEITVTFGDEGLLKCGYERKPYAVYWRFVSDSSYGDLLVALDQYYQVGERSGAGYDEGRFNITNDYSLLIHDVSVEDEGRYICEVSDFETGQVFRNYTNVTVTVQAVRPLVRIHQCERNNPVSVNVTDNPKASCMVKTIPDQRHVQLDCFVEGAKPQVDMFWIDNTTLQDLSNGTFLTITQGKREGTVDQKLTVILEVSEFQSNQEYYFTCIAEGPAVQGIASVTIGINNVPPGVSTGGWSSVGLVVLVVLVVLILVVLIYVLLWKKYKRPQRQKDGDLPMDTDSSERMDNESTPLNDDPPMADNETRTPVDGDHQEIETRTPLDGDLPMETESSEKIDNRSTHLNDDPEENETSTPVDADPQLADNETLTPSDANPQLVDNETLTPSDDDHQLADNETLTLSDADPQLADNETLTPSDPDKRPLLLDKRKKIEDFSPSTSTTMSDDTHRINLGVFGLTKTGRSSLIKSLIFSLKGHYPSEVDGRATDSTQQIEERELTNHIHLLNYKGIVEYDRTKPKEVFYRIKGQPIQITSKVPVHCAIFVCDYRNRKGRSQKFMQLLSKDVRRYFGRGIMLVIPKEDDLDGDDDTIKAEMSDTFGIPEDNVQIFANYTLESHEEDVERSIGFLDFILHCLNVPKETQQPRNSQAKKEWTNFFLKK